MTKKQKSIAGSIAIGVSVIVIAAIVIGFLTSSYDVVSTAVGQPKTNKSIELKINELKECDSIQNSEILKQQKIKAGTQVELRNLQDDIKELKDGQKEIIRILLTKQ